MVLSIRTNVSAIASLAELNKGVAKTQRSFAKLSSGSRITTARDDASGLAISNNLRLDLASAKSALSNIAQATSVIQIADAGLQTIQDKIDRMHEIASMAASSNLSDIERGYLDVEFQQLKTSISDDIRATTFNGENLLGERPDYALGPVGSDIDDDNGVVGFQFDNDGLFAENDIFELTYDSATGVFRLENTNTSYVETIAGPGAITPGKTSKLDFAQLGVTITLSSDFDFATDIDPGINDASFIVRLNDPTAVAFSPTDLTNLVVNLSAENSTVNVIGTGIQSISDLEVTGGGNNATQGAAGARPTLDYGGVFGRDAINFDGVDDFLAIADNAAINLNVRSQRTIALNFETGADVNTTQVIYEEGANVNGLGIYIQGGQLFMGAYRNNGATEAYVSVPIAANTQYTASYDFDATTNTARGYLNGVEFASIAGIGAALPSHNGDIGLGGVNQQVRLADGTLVNSGANFQGKVADFLLYNDSFAAADHANLNLYLRNATGAATAGFSNESLAFQIDHAQGEQLVYRKAQTDFLVSQLEVLSVTSIGNANTARDELRSATEFISTERSKIGSLLSQLEYAGQQVSTFQENTTNANSVLRDADVAELTTQLASDVLRDRVNILSLRAANGLNDQLLNLLRA